MIAIGIVVFAVFGYAHAAVASTARPLRRDASVTAACVDLLAAVETVRTESPRVASRRRSLAAEARPRLRVIKGRRARTEPALAIAA